MLFFSNSRPKYTSSSNRLNTDDKLINTSSVIKDIYIRPCISLIRDHIQYICLKSVLYTCFYFGGWKRFVFESKLMTEIISCFEMTNFRVLDTLAIYSNISKIRLLIQITLYKNAQNTNGYIKEQAFLSRGSNKLYSSHQEKKEGTSMWNVWVLWVFVLPHAVNFIMKTEGDRRQTALRFLNHLN